MTSELGWGWQHLDLVFFQPAGLVLRVADLPPIIFGIEDANFNAVAQIVATLGFFKRAESNDGFFVNYYGE